MFYGKWSKYDPHATQFITFNQMSDFINSLDPPLGIQKPNMLAIVSFDLPIAKGDKIHCLDVLHSLTKYTLGFVEDESEDFSKLTEQGYMITQYNCLNRGINFKEGWGGGKKVKDFINIFHQFIWTIKLSVHILELQIYSPLCYRNSRLVLSLRMKTRISQSSVIIFSKVTFHGVAFCDLKVRNAENYFCLKSRF